MELMSRLKWLLRFSSKVLRSSCFSCIPRTLAFYLQSHHIHTIFLLKIIRSVQLCLQFLTPCNYTLQGIQQLNFTLPEQINKYHHSNQFTRSSYLYISIVFKYSSALVSPAGSFFSLWSARGMRSSINSVLAVVSSPSKT